MAYGWNGAEQKWDLLGEVMTDPNAPTDGDGIGAAKTVFYAGDRLFEAGEYDHVFDVELGDGIMRKLPFNNGAPRRTAAEMFCSRESLSRVMIEQID
jgi:phospholipase A-2-activating protein